ncbi:hypothetical protein [Spongiactinospora sp. 9N601]
MPVLRLFEEIKALGYTCNLNLFYCHLPRGREEADRPAISGK